MLFIRKIFAYIPQLEVCSRILYKDYLRKRDSKIEKKYLKDHVPEQKEVPEFFNKLADKIGELNHCRGEILIVHSSMDALERAGKTADEILDFLTSLIGKDGTLVMPAYPFYMPQEIELKFDEEEEPVKKYNPKITPAWTGGLPNAMCGRPGALRSLFPNNTLVAIGKEAECMMEHNLEADVSHGEHSAWKYCSDRHAKILYLGIEPFHALSLIHIAEDMLDEKWPVKGWYKKQKYVIHYNGQTMEKECRVRKRFWSRYLTEQYCARKLQKAGLLFIGDIQGIPIAFINDCNKVTEFVLDSVKKGDLLFYRIPERYLRQ